MNYTAIRIQGSILSFDVLERLDTFVGQKQQDFGFPSGRTVREEIARAWGNAQECWCQFEKKLERTGVDSSATTETRNHWIIPLLGLVGYAIEYQGGVTVNGISYRISHKVANRGDMPVHILGCQDVAGVDHKPVGGPHRMSGHAMVQEFINLDERLYGIVTNGLVLRALRENSRLVKQSYIEFDLPRIFREGLYADFAILFRLLHVTRFPLSRDDVAECLFEKYHVASLESGERIRTGLSDAVKDAIIQFGEGFLSHSCNESLQNALRDPAKTLCPHTLYQHLLRLIYRLLFLFVVEQRNLVFPDDEQGTQSEEIMRKRNIYWNYYSVQRLRSLSGRSYFADKQKHDLWLALLANFHLFENADAGARLGVPPLGGELFSEPALGLLSGCLISNDILIRCIRALSMYTNPDSGQRVRVNYGALDTEELGSVYEGLLEYAPKIIWGPSGAKFTLQASPARSTSGSHYTPDKLVQPLIKHSLDPLISACQKDRDPQKSLLNLRIADISCGSGHILLAAGRRVATALASAQTGEDQPTPAAFRHALRDVIRHCIYGVDINPLAVELCKVSLWLEAHMPGEPLNFLDDRIRCGNSIVGQVHLDDVLDGCVPSEAFVAHYNDDRRIASAWTRANNRELKHRTVLPGQGSLFNNDFEGLCRQRERLVNLPETDLSAVEHKKHMCDEFFYGENYVTINRIASIPVAQFFLEKTKYGESYLISHQPFIDYRDSRQGPDEARTEEAGKAALRERFFHWFAEFPEVMNRGGFDCILGNPPFLGGKRLSGTFGHRFCDYAKWSTKAGLSELMVFFLHRVCDLLKSEGFSGLIATNSIVDGRVRKDGLEKVLQSGYTIHMAEVSKKWPGKANVRVSLLGLYKGAYSGPRTLNNAVVRNINSRLEDSDEKGSPRPIPDNLNRMKMGTIYLGEGFLLTHTQADQLIYQDARNQEVIVPIMGGIELNRDPHQRPARKIIDFQDWPEHKAKEYPTLYDLLVEKVKPVRQQKNRGSNTWWLFLHRRTPMYEKIRKLPHCFATTLTTKHLNFSQVSTDGLFSSSIFVLMSDRWDIFAVVQSALHESWARKYSGTLVDRLSYSCTNCFETFPFPEGLWKTPNESLARIGRKLHELRREMMRSHQIGLTDMYNLYHSEKVVPSTRGQKFHDLLRLRSLSVELDNSVLDAYGWSDIDLEHNLHVADNLLEDDKIRFTISNVARHKILTHLLDENQKQTAHG